MLKRIIISMFILFIILAFPGCSGMSKESIVKSEPTATASSSNPKPSAISIASADPSPSVEQEAEPVSDTPAPDTIEPSNIPTFPETPTPEEVQLNYDTSEHNGWIYYLVYKDESIRGLDEAIHRKKVDGTGDEDLGISGFCFNFAGQYLYVDTNNNDLGTWETTRCSLDGSTKQKLDYKGMCRYFKDGIMYFTVSLYSNIYITNSACENPETIKVNIPDAKDVSKEIGNDWNGIYVDIDQVKDGWIYFSYQVSGDRENYFYLGNYRMEINSKKIEKTNEGEYDDENEECDG